MDVRNSQLIVVVFLLFALLVGVTAYVGFRNVAWHATHLEWAEEDESSSDQQWPAHSRRSANLDRRRRMAATDQSHTINRLRDLLEQRSNALQQQQQLLAQARAESRTHKAQLEQLQAEQIPVPGQPLIESTPESAATASDTTETRVASLGEGLLERILQGEEPLPNPLDATGTEPEMELAALEWELTQSQARVMELELSVLREIETSTRATEAVIGAGPSAVPTLMATLTDANPDLRRWAATVLGRMGLDATDAVGALRQAMRDTDATVAAAARSALDQIEGRF